MPPPVSRKESFIHDAKNAIKKDFEDRLEAALKSALPPKVKSSNNMGSLLK